MIKRVEKNNNKRWCLLIKQVLPKINVLHNLAPNQGVEHFVHIVEHSLRNYGENEAIRVLKSYRNIIHQFALGQTVTPIRFCKTDKDGFPKVLKPWKISTKSSTDEIRYVMSVWRSIDLFRTSPKYEVETIVSQTQPDENLIDEITDFIKSWKGLKLLGSKPDKGYLIMSNKAGPNGPASISCIHDLKPLRESPLLYINIQRLMNISVPGLILDDYKTPTWGRTHSKLVLLSDKACKTRVVAIAD